MGILSKGKKYLQNAWGRHSSGPVLVQNDSIKGRINKRKKRGNKKPKAGHQQADKDSSGIEGDSNKIDPERKDHGTRSEGA